MAGGYTEDCFVCRKHRDRGPLVPGGPVAEDELVLVSHVVTPGAPGREGATAYLGHLLVSRGGTHRAWLTLPMLRPGAWAGGARGRAGLCVTWPGPSMYTRR